MGKYNEVGLYPHNEKAYDAVKEKLQQNRVASVIHATGTGKSFIGLQWIYDNKDKITYYVVPLEGIKDHIIEEINSNPNLDFERDFPNIKFITYQALAGMNDEDIQNLEIDNIVLDEFHHIGAPIWGDKVKTLLKTHENLKVLGLTAYTVRDRGTSYERNMIGENEVFADSVISKYDLADAIIDGILPLPVYKSGYIKFEKVLEEIEQNLEKQDHSTDKYIKNSEDLKNAKRQLHNAKNMSDIFKVNIKPNGKYIYYCPLNATSGINDIKTIKEEAKKWLSEMGLSGSDFEFYETTCKDEKVGKANREAFYNDKNLSGQDSSGKLRIMFAINQYNEGIHPPGVNGVIMGRDTASDIVYFEQLGRALSVTNIPKEEKVKLRSKTYEELIEICNKRELKLEGNENKEELIELLLSPVVIDLAGNVQFIKELEDKIKDRIKQIIAENKTTETKRILKILNTSFRIEMLNEDFYETLLALRDQLTITPEKYVELIRKYCETYNEWPKSTSNDKKIEGKTGNQLAVWLANSGYNKDKFKYNVSLKNILDKLHDKYVEEVMTPEKYVELIRKYCEAYNEWPKNSTENEIDGKTGQQLAQWLAGTSGYNKGKFEYGEELKNTLDELYMEFSKESKFVKSIKEYCETHNEWPRDNKKSEEIGEKTETQLARWLYYSGYNDGNFKYRKELKSILDELYIIYLKEVRYVEIVRKYCQIYEEWPKYNSEKEIDGKTGKQLYEWFRSSGYANHQFKYGEELEQQLDELKAQYDKRKNKFNLKAQEFDSQSEFNKQVEKQKDKGKKK